MRLRYLLSLLLLTLCGQGLLPAQTADNPPAQGGAFTQQPLLGELTPGTSGTPGTPGTLTTPGTPGTPGTPPTVGPVSLTLQFNDGQQDVGIAIQLVAIMTLLTLAPSIVIMMTCFTRITIVLGFVRAAVGTPTAPSNQIIIGIALFLTLFIMSPVLDKIYAEAIIPYQNKEITSKDALVKASDEMKVFMLRQCEERNIEFFMGLAGMGPSTADELPLRVVVPAFILSELRTAFQMGFLIYVPFLVIDFLVASVLMAMGMMMMPPAIVAMPFKILLFVLVDGWYLVVTSLVKSF